MCISSPRMGPTEFSEYISRVFAEGTFHDPRLM